MTSYDIAIRLLAAFAIGSALGLNRDLHRKPEGMRTIGIVSLAAAMVVLAAGNVAPGQLGSLGVSPIISGILTGVGFLGAGVIVRGQSEGSIHGLTTAAIIWLAAGLGVLSALGEWVDLAIGTTLVFISLIFGGRLEQRINRSFEAKSTVAQFTAQNSAMDDD